MTDGTGQAAEVPCLQALLAAVRSDRSPTYLIGDRAYSSRAARTWLLMRRIRPVIPFRADQKRSWHCRTLRFNRQLYRRRNIVERCVGWLKHCRNLASRSDKLALNFLAWIKLAMIRQSLRRLCPSDTTYAPDRKAERPVAHLRGFAGVLQVDGRAGYRKLAEGGAVRLAFRWSHVRKGFYDLQTGGSAPIASEALVRIAKLYAVEGEIRGHDAEARRQERQARSAPLIAELKTWLEKQLAAVSRKSTLAEAMRCALIRWEGLTLFFNDGRVEFDSNSVERCIRPLALTRKNALFAGSDGDGEHWATIASLAETCQLNGADPQAWFADVLTKLAGRHPITKLDELLPWAFARQAEPAVA
ncbi:IS66 family transposase [Azospirillum brasilense]|nr:IS66 family transposase [Azospirillum argentinense]